MKRFFARHRILRIALELTLLMGASICLFDALFSMLPASFISLLDDGRGSAHLLLFVPVGFLLIYLYLKRVLSVFIRQAGLAGVSGAVPLGVKVALDTLTPGVVLIAPRGEILLANRTFRSMNPNGDEAIEGRSINELDWFVAPISTPVPVQPTGTAAVPVTVASGAATASAVASADNEFPWQTVIRTNQGLLRKSVSVKRANGKVQELVLNCSSINDEFGISRGCIISVDDVTLLSNAKIAIVQAMKNLKLSAEQIQRQNVELQKHANLDPMTGCLNRRAFFSVADPLFRKLQANGGVLFCIMLDIDHFKLVNDRHGHSVGDLVIQQVANTVHRSLRPTDLFCRYGGEEFCLLLDGGEPDGVLVAERIRERVEREGGLGVRSVPGMRVTSSFGVSAIGLGTPVATLKDLIDLADAALYESKRKGRNQVTFADHALQVAGGNH